MVSSPGPDLLTPVPDPSTWPPGCGRARLGRLWGVTAYLLLSVLGGQPSIRLTRLSGVWEPGIVVGGVHGLYGWLGWRLNGTYGRAALGVMASSVVVGLVLGLRIVDDRRRLDLRHLVLLLIKKHWFIEKDGQTNSKQNQFCSFVVFNSPDLWRMVGTLRAEGGKVIRQENTLWLFSTNRDTQNWIK